MVVYVDLVFLLNFLIDGALLLLTAWIRKKQPRLWRLAGSAAVGGLYVALIVIPELSVLYTFLIKVLFSVLMLAIAFGKDHLRGFMRTVGAFYGVATAAAGGIFGLHYLLMSSGQLWTFLIHTQTGGMEFRFFFVAAVFVGASWLYLRQFQHTRQQQTIASFLAQVEIQVGEFRFACRGLIDTGNQLYDPLTRTPVMVVEAEGWKELLPEPWLKRIREADVDRIVASLDQDDFPWPDRLRLVPYRGVNRGTQFMLAIKPDQVSVSLEGKQVDSSRVLVGFDGGKLSADGTYQAIIHPALMEA